MPHPLELPRTLRAVVMLVRRERFPGFWRCIVEKHVALTLRHAIRTHEVFRFGSGRVPCFATVV